MLIPPHGHVRLRHEGNDHDLGPGTATHIEIGERVSLANSGPEPAELLVVATPPDFAAHPSPYGRPHDRKQRPRPAQ